MSTGVGGRSAAELSAALAVVLAEVLEVDVVEPGAGFFDDLGADSLVMAKFCSRVRKRIDLPNVSMKDVYRWPSVSALAAGLAAAAPAGAVVPAPATGEAPAVTVAGPETVVVAGSAGAASESAAPPAAELAGQLAQLLAEVLEIPEVRGNAQFFEELGTDSLTMAKFCSRVRKRADLPNVSMKDVYRDPTIDGLVRTLQGSIVMVPPSVLAPADVIESATTVAPASSPMIPAPTASTEPTAPSAPVARASLPPVGRLQYFLCGLTQILLMLTVPVVLAVVMVLADDWLSDYSSPLNAYLRTLAFSASVVAATFVIPVAGKWLLIGRWKPTEIRAWSWNYLRFWVVKSLVQKSPWIKLLSGSPLMNVYLRALGARIGKGTTIFASQIPLCTDLITIGSDTLIRKSVLMAGYHAEAGVIRTGRVTIGDRVIVGTTAVLDIDTRMGDDSQLGHASALHPGQSVPAGERWYGNPAEAGDVDFGAIARTGRSRRRRFTFGTFQLFNLVVFVVPIGLLVLAGAFVLPEYLTGKDWGSYSLTQWSFYEYALWISAMLFFGVALVAFPLLVLTARFASLFVKQGREYPLHGMRHTLLRYISRVTNMKFYGALAADCFLVVHYLRSIGWRLKPYVQTGTNFGTVQHDTPFGISIGKGTVVADAFMVNNVDYSASNFRVTPTRLGDHSFVGNLVSFPAGARVGDDCLLGTMVMVPIDGELRQGVGLLGSPPIEIPRTVARDHNLAVTDPAEIRRGVRRKRRHNLRTMFAFLVSRWFPMFVIFVGAEGTGELYNRLGDWSFVIADTAYAMFMLSFYVFTERIAMRYATLAPNGVSIYDKRFWRHERYWKLPTHGFPQVFNGTPLKAVCWRLLGAKVGKRLLDDGAGFPERCYVRVGDNVTLNMSSVVQNHSQEDGAFKCDVTYVGDGATVGVAAFVHYGVTVGERVVIGPASFLMKGEQVPDDERWGGNPAEPLDLPIVPTAVEAARVPRIPAARGSEPDRSRLLVSGYSLVLGVGGAYVTLTGAMDGEFPVVWTGVGAAVWLIGLVGLLSVLRGASSARRERRAEQRQEAAIVLPRLSPTPAPAVESPVVIAAAIEPPVVEAPVVEAPVVQAPVVQAPAAAVPVVKIAPAAIPMPVGRKWPVQTSKRKADAAEPMGSPRSTTPRAEAPRSEPVSTEMPKLELPELELPKLDLPALSGSQDAWARLSAQLDALEELRAKWASGDSIDSGK